MGLRKIYVDETTLGGGGVDLLQEKMDNVEGITFSLKQKSIMYKNLKRYLERKRLKIMKDDRLINQLMAMVHEYTSGGELKIHAPENIRDDYPDSLSLACCGFEDGLAKSIGLEVPSGVDIFN